MQATGQPLAGRQIGGVGFTGDALAVSVSLENATVSELNSLAAQYSNTQFESATFTLVADRFHDAIPMTAGSSITNYFRPDGTPTGNTNVCTLSNSYFYNGRVGYATAGHCGDAGQWITTGLRASARSELEPDNPNAALYRIPVGTMTDDNESSGLDMAFIQCASTPCANNRVWVGGTGSTNRDNLDQYYVQKVKRDGWCISGATTTAEKCGYRFKKFQKTLKIGGTTYRNVMLITAPDGQIAGLGGDSGSPVYRASDADGSKLIYGGIASAVDGSTLAVVPAWEVLDKTGGRPAGGQGVTDDCGVSPNPNFADGINSWTTDYTPADMWPEGTYAIGPSLLAAAPSWGEFVIGSLGATNITPKTSGNVLFVNAAAAPDKRVLSRQITGLIPGEQYQLVVPMRRIVTNGTVRISIDGIPKAGVAIASLAVSAWTDVVVPFTAPAGDPRIDLVLNETTGVLFGGDFAISNVELRNGAGGSARLSC